MMGDNAVVMMKVGDGAFMRGIGQIVNDHQHFAASRLRVRTTSRAGAKRGGL